MWDSFGPGAARSQRTPPRSYWGMPVRRGTKGFYRYVSTPRCLLVAAPTFTSCWRTNAFLLHNPSREDSYVLDTSSETSTNIGVKLGFILRRQRDIIGHWRPSTLLYLGDIFWKTGNRQKSHRLQEYVAAFRYGRTKDNNVLRNTHTVVDLKNGFNLQFP